MGSAILKVYSRKYISSTSQKFKTCYELISFFQNFLQNLIARHFNTADTNVENINLKGKFSFLYYGKKRYYTNIETIYALNFVGETVRFVK